MAIIIVTNTGAEPSISGDGYGYMVGGDEGAGLVRILHVGCIYCFEELFMCPFEKLLEAWSG